MTQLRLFDAAEDAALRARFQGGAYLTRPIWRDLFEAGRQHGLAGGAPLPRNRHGAAYPTPAARAVLDAYFTTTAHLDAPMNSHNADMFEAGRKAGAAERKRGQA
jgi:hypothetical protein